MAENSQKEKNVEIENFENYSESPVLLSEESKINSENPPTNPKIPKIQTKARKFKKSIKDPKIPKKIPKIHR